MSAEKDLQKEILYLTNLIQSHKKSSNVPKPTSYEHTRWLKTSQSRPHHTTHSRKALNNNHRQNSRTFHSNRVYKPATSSEVTVKVKTPSTIVPAQVAHVCSKAVQPSAVLSSSSSPVSASVVPTKKQHGNLVYRPSKSVDSTVGSVSVSAAQLSTEQLARRVEATKVKESASSRFKWKRSSISDDQTRPFEAAKRTPRQLSFKATPRSSRKRPQQHRNTLYKWRRRSSSGSKESAAKSPVSPMIAQSRFKLTRASLVRTHSSSPFSRSRGGTFRQRRLSYRKKRMLLSQHFKSTRTPIRTKSLKKSKNKVWVAPNPNADTTTNQTASSNLIGREIKTSRGNKQWVASASSSSQSHERKRSGLVLLRGDNFVQDRTGRRLKRLSSTTKLAQVMRRRSGSFSDVVKSPSVKQYLASQAVRKSRLYVWNAKHKDKSKQYCMFFNRFGKCNHRDTCPYIHDPDKIAVCTKFLRGVCEKTDGTCPFSHKISKEKMPVCSFFLRGVCTKEACPYLHVSVGREAEVCMDFVRGYCPRGEECNMQHILDCPEFLEKGVCSRGKACPLRHRQRLYRTRKERAQPSEAAPISSVKEPYAFKVARRRLRAEKGTEVSPDTSEDLPIEPVLAVPSSPFDMSTAPDFIAL